MNEDPEVVEPVRSDEQGLVGPSFQLSPREWLELAASIVLELFL
jgi:hypothetical protein